MSRTLFEECCYGGSQGEKLRVAQRYRRYGLKGLNQGDTKIFQRGLGTEGEHLEAIRLSFLRIAARSAKGENLTPEELENLPAAIQAALTEGDKP